jgi:predicted metal-dependent phosphoesterase TrpH
LIDLHLHTTASDGLCSPRQLVEEAAAAGITTLAVTDHDTMAAAAEVSALSSAAGIRFVPGIEITAIENGADVHILGYFLDAGSPRLAAFLTVQRASRIRRVEAIAERLAALGVHIDVRPLLEIAGRQDGTSVGRPQVARAIVAAGHAADTNDAFERWLGRGRPGFVPRSGATSEEVLAIIHEAGGLASLAHPGVTTVDARLAAWRDAGLDALEAYHSEHHPDTRDRYLRLARDLGLLVTGGSDYHGDPAHGVAPGMVTLPPHEFERLQRRSAERRVRV